VTNITETRVQHHAGTHRKSLRDLPTETLAKVEALTRVDVALYRMALMRFLKEIRWLERNGLG